MLIQGHFFIAFRERGRETSMEERNIDQLPASCTLSREQTHNLGMCPDKELNLQPFGVFTGKRSNQATLVRAVLYFAHPSFYLGSLV